MSNAFAIYAKCDNGHTQKLRCEGMDIAVVENLARIMDGTSEFFVYPVPDGSGTPGSIGHCGICGARFKTEVHVDERDENTVTLSGKPPNPDYAGPAPQPIDPATGMHGDYYVLSEDERSKGYVRPVRQTYRHEKCGKTTTMGMAIAETYARNPGYYSGTFCAHCREHFPVGKNGEFVWEDGSKVGT